MAWDYRHRTGAALRIVALLLRTGPAGGHADVRQGLVQCYNFDNGGIAESCSPGSRLRPQITHGVALYSLDTTAYATGTASLSKARGHAIMILSDPSDRSNTAEDALKGVGGITVSFYMHLKDLRNDFGNVLTIPYRGGEMDDQMRIHFRSAVGHATESTHHLSVKCGTIDDGYVFDGVTYQALGITGWENLTYGRFHHFAVVCSVGKEARVYVDGVQRLHKTRDDGNCCGQGPTTGVVAAIMSSSDPFFAYETPGPPVLYDDYRIYSRALTERQVGVISDTLPGPVEIEAPIEWPQGPASATTPGIAQSSGSGWKAFDKLSYGTLTFIEVSCPLQTPRLE